MSGMKRAHDSDVVVPTEAIHPSRRRRLDYTEADAQLAKIYNDLADDVQAVRLKAAGEVIDADVAAETAKLKATNDAAKV